MVLLLLTEVAAEVGFWVLKNTVILSWNGVCWTARKIRGNSSPETEEEELKETVEKLQLEVKELQEECTKLEQSVIK